MDEFWIEWVLGKRSSPRQTLEEISEDFQVYAIAMAFYLAEEKLNDGKTYQELIRKEVRFSGPKWIKSLNQAIKVIKTNSVKVFKCNVSNCPHVIFVSGWQGINIPMVGFFNSRTSRRITPSDPWLIGLKYVFKSSEKFNIGYITSSSHLPYEIVDVWAKEKDRYRLKIQPTPLRNYHNLGETTLSCCLWPIRCNSRQMMQCRDRIISSLSDAWVIISLREKSSLLPVLMQSFKDNPRPIAIWIPQSKKTLSKGNKKVVEAISPLFTWEIPTSFWKETNRLPRKSATNLFKNVEELNIPWNEYLYHYTRPSLGPMQGESREEYIKRLLDGDPLATNSDIDILINIARTGILKASRGIFKGNLRVVSFTSVPPLEILKIKKWNSASMRWTVGHCGIAIKKRKLKKLGAKPVCYINSKDYFRLPPSERYRYQKHEPPKSLWKHEKEWRIRHDVDISRLDENSAFWFVQTYEEAEKFATFAETTLSIIVLEKKRTK